MFGDDHPEVATSLEGLAGAAYMARRYDEAAAIYLQTQRVYEAAFGPASFRVANVLNNLANVYSYQGKSAEAVELHRRAIAIDEQTLGPEHPTTLVHLAALGAALEELDRHDEALVVLASTLERQHRQLGADHPRIAETLANLALVEMGLRRFAAARAYAERASAMFHRVLGEAYRPYAELRMIGEASLELGEAARAAQVLEQAKQSLGEDADPGDLSWIDGLLGRALIDSGRDPQRGRTLVSSAWAQMSSDARMDAQRARLAAWMKRRGMKLGR